MIRMIPMSTWTPMMVSHGLIRNGSAGGGSPMLEGLHQATVTSWERPWLVNTACED